MNGDSIVKAIEAKGANVSAIAETLDVSPTSVSRVIKGESKSRRIATTIAVFLGTPVDTLWPGQYPDTYRRKRASDAARKQLQVAAMLASRRAA